MLAIRMLMVGLMTALGLTIAARAQAAPRCVPRSVNSSAVLARSVTVSPLSGSRDASPHTQISFLGVPATELRSVRVSGSRSGSHSGHLLAYPQGDGASFVPRRAFAEGERVTVRAAVHQGSSTHALYDVFIVAEQDQISETPEHRHRGNRAEVQHFQSRADLNPPTVTVTAASSQAAPGEIFTAPYNGPGEAGPMILESSGALVWFKPLPAGKEAANLQVQAYRGAPALTWWQGDISVHGFGLGEDIVADATYSDIAHVRAGNGYLADLHEFRLQPNGTALITAYAPIRCDLTAVAGAREGAVVDGVLQEIDVKTGLVRFEWTSLDHVHLDESYERAARSSVSFPFDYFHINSINVDADDSLLISARNTWTVYDLDRRSGQVHWRLGGKRSSFHMGAGTGTAWQHDPRELQPGVISIFDNGAAPKVRAQSRGIVVRLDERHATASLVAQLTHAPPVLADSQGNLQALANGDWFLGWGERPYFSELSPGGAVLLDAHFPSGVESYRDLRFPWTGTPAHRPALAFTAAAGGGGTAYASWNGATLVSAWRALAGTSPDNLAAIAQVPRSGFETAIPLPAGSTGAYLTVEALDSAGAVLATAAVASTAGR